MRKTAELGRNRRRALRNLRQGRVQRALAAATALSALPLGLEIYFEHFRGSFGDKWMWTPVVLSPALSAAGIAAMRSERAARTALPLISALYCLDGLIGIYTHVQGVRKRPGGFSEPLYNIVMGPPLLAPGSLALVGGMGLVAAAARRER
jgi:heme A synthase